jgi:hypothetical protein
MDARLSADIPVFGLHGQLLGYVRHLVLDLAAGHVRQVVLETRWQPVALNWDRLEFDAACTALRIRRDAGGAATPLRGEGALSCPRRGTP